MAAPMLLDNIHVQWRFGAGGRFFLFGALLTVCLISPTETLEVTMFANPKSVLVNEDISLECKFFGFNPAAFNLKKVGIQWLGPNNQEIYVFNGGAATSKRIGAKMSTDALQKGDASLHLPKIQLTEEGEYTCIVFITPEKAEEKSTLEVSARPVISLSREHIKILIGSEGTLSCNVTGFYPEQHGLIWQKISNKGSKEPKNLTDVCSRAVTPNNDGTFSVSSKITIVPTLDDDGDVYRCFVTHRSVRPDGISQESTLRVIETSEPEENLAVNILLFLFVSLCMLLGAILCWYKFRGVPPEITCKPPIMYHLEETIVSYQILRFKPRNIAIYLFVKRREDKKEEKIFEWHSQEHRTSSAPRDTTYKVQPLINGNEEDPSFQQLQPVFYDNGDGTFKVQGSIKMYPDVFRDNEAELIFHVQHKTFAQPAVKSVTLDVRGVPPKVSDVVAPLQAHHNEPVALTCSVNGFKPRPLMIQWQQVRMDGGLKKIVHLDQDNRTIFDADDGMIHKYKHQINEIKYKDESYGITSILIITPDVLEDQLTKYICEVQHRCTNSVAMKEITLHITAPPKLDKITCAEEIIAEKPMTLSCRIHSFYPKNIKVTWLKSGEAMTQGSEKPTMGHDGLYYLTSSVKSVPTRADVGKTYTCRVEHESLKEPLEDSWVLDQLGIPSVEDIKFDPPEAVYGSDLVLSCSISNFYPQTIETAWHNKQGQIVKGITIKGPVKDERGCFRLTSHLQIKPTAQDFNGVFYFHVNHVQLKAPIVKQTSLTLPAHSPTLSSIEADPPVPEANQLVTFSISLKSYAPEVVQVKWFKNGKPCSGQVSNPCPVIANDGLFSSVTSIKFKANENDHESLIRCEVIHIETKEIGEKIFKLLLKGVDSEDAAYENLGNDEGRATNYL